MASRTFQGVPKKAFAKTQERETAESKYWRSFVTTGETKLDTSPNCVSFCQNLPDYYLVTGGSGAYLYDSSTDKVQRSFSRFSDAAYSGKLRRDGKVFVAGEKTGHVKVFDVESKFMLRDLRGHTGAVRATTWTSDGLTIVSGSDDASVRRWDLSTGSVLWNSSSGGGQQQHSDYVRFVDTHPNDPNIFASGSYDHTVKLWDARQAKPIVSIQHDFPVETCIFNPSGTFMITAGKNEVHVWDMLCGASPVHTFRCHQKNISSLAMNASGSTLISAGLDGHVKVYNMQKLSLSHGMQFYSPISSVGFAKFPEQEKLIIGFVSGSVVSRTLKAKKKQQAPSAVQGNDRRMGREVGDAIENVEDALIVAEKIKQLKPYEKLLKKFSYQKALDSALKTRNPLTIVTVLEELSSRNGIAIALAGRNESSLEPLLSFAAKYISNPRYSKLTMQIIHHVLDLYGNILGHSDSIDELFVKLRRQIKKEVEFQQQACTILGALEVVLSNSSL